MPGVRVVRSLVVAVLAVVLLAVPSVVLADGRVALVVGNSTCALCTALIWAACCATNPAVVEALLAAGANLAARSEMNV